MRPLTFQGVLLRCGILAFVLFIVVVIALKLGAVPVSLYGFGLDLLHVLVRKTSELSSNYNLIVYDIRLPRILLAVIVGASLAVAGTAFHAPPASGQAGFFWASSNSRTGRCPRFRPRIAAFAVRSSTSITRTLSVVQPATCGAAASRLKPSSTSNCCPWAQATTGDN